MQDAFEDAVLMGVDEQAMRAILAGMVRALGAAPSAPPPNEARRRAAAGGPGARLALVPPAPVASALAQDSGFDAFPPEAPVPRLPPPPPPEELPEPSPPEPFGPRSVPRRPSRRRRRRLLSGSRGPS